LVSILFFDIHPELKAKIGATLLLPVIWDILGYLYKKGKYSAMKRRVKNKKKC